MKDWKITLAAARVNAGLTQTEAAEKIGVSQITISNWETGKTSPKMSIVPTIAALYKIPVHDLLFVQK
jgi:DNA-binding XRE family transcriptional regulator